MKLHHHFYSTIGVGPFAFLKMNSRNSARKLFSGFFCGIMCPAIQSKRSVMKTTSILRHVRRRQASAASGRRAVRSSASCRSRSKDPIRLHGGMNLYAFCGNEDSFPAILEGFMQGVLDRKGK